MKRVQVYLLRDDLLETLVSYNLWSMFSLTELTEEMTEKGELKFIQPLNIIRVRNIDEDVKNKLKARLIKEFVHE